MLKKLSGLVLALMLVVGLAACGNGSSAASATKKENGRIVVTFWHSMSGEPQKTLEKIVDDYNHSQKKVLVKAQFQGTYEESLPKYLSVGGTDKAPTMIQVQEIGTKAMINSGFIQPVQKFIDKDHYDTSQLEKNIINYYTVDNKLNSMPFNSSTPVLYYNADAFQQAGIKLNPEDVTFEQIREDAKKITDSTNGQMKGFALQPYGWLFEELLANQNGLLVNKENGHAGTPTKAVFNSKEGKNILQWAKDMIQDKTFVDYGTGTTAGDDMTAGFLSGKVAMFIQSSASIRDVVNNAKFKVGVAYLPHPQSIERNGVAIGGASLWMSKGKSSAEQNAAWDFMKYLASPHVQAEWHVGTGYFAVNTKAYSDPVVVDAYKKIPQLQVSVNQLQASKPSPTTQGALMQSLPEERTAVETAMESVYNGEDIDKALDKAVNDTNSAIEKANKANGAK
ncbi:ABC transporter substrate-binding protein [Pullulanibacillus camelliae]|uniref:ABC transporter substrate-binding protein n=1 Tax=Pullulanibacillus camelliae TaxID=1707096 RepID=A0A8J2YC58_9BACL|nr:ABC transporter substrate-binding protein [Pullulanibacillus camelliae]GGE29899.1 ABC transporter substrate-binding protein [Pullulanibacillus camelliae]